MDLVRSLSLGITASVTGARSWVVGVAALTLGGCTSPLNATPSEDHPLDLDGGLEQMETYLSGLADGDLAAAFGVVCTRGPSATTWEAFEAHHERQPAIIDYRVYPDRAARRASAGRGSTTTTAVFVDVDFDDGHRIEGARPMWQSFGLCSVASEDGEVARLDPTP